MDLQQQLAKHGVRCRTPRATASRHRHLSARPSRQRKLAVERVNLARHWQLTYLSDLYHTLVNLPWSAALGAAGAARRWRWRCSPGVCRAGCAPPPKCGAPCLAPCLPPALPGVVRRLHVP